MSTCGTKAATGSEETGPEKQAGDGDVPSADVASSHARAARSSGSACKEGTPPSPAPSACFREGGRLVHVPREIHSEVRALLKIPAPEKKRCLLTWNIQAFDETGDAVSFMRRTLELARQVAEVQPFAVMLQEARDLTLDLLLAPKVLGRRYAAVRPDGPTLPGNLLILLDQEHAEPVGKVTAIPLSGSSGKSHLISVPVRLGGRDGRDGPALLLATASLQSGESNADRQARREQLLCCARHLKEMIGRPTSERGCSIVGAALGGDFGFGVDEELSTQFRDRDDFVGIDDVFEYLGSPEAARWTYEGTADHDRSGRSRCSRLYFIRTPFSEAISGEVDADAGGWRPTAMSLVGSRIVPMLDRPVSCHLGVLTQWTLGGSEGEKSADPERGRRIRGKRSGNCPSKRASSKRSANPEQGRRNAPVPSAFIRRVRLKVKSQPSAYVKLDQKKQEAPPVKVNPGKEATPKKPKKEGVAASKGSAVLKSLTYTVVWRCQHCGEKFEASDDLIVHFGTSHQAEQLAHDKACFDAGSKRAAADVLKEGCASASEVATLVAISKANAPPPPRPKVDATMCLFCDFVGSVGTEVYRHMVVAHTDKAIPYRRLPFFLPRLYDLTRQGEASPVPDPEYDLWTCAVCCYAARRKQDVALHISKTHHKPVVMAASAAWKVRHDGRNLGLKSIADGVAEDPTTLAGTSDQTAVTDCLSSATHGGGSSSSSAPPPPPPPPPEPQVTARTSSRRKAPRLMNISRMVPKPSPPVVIKEPIDREGPPFVCKECKISFMSFEGLRGHRNKARIHRVDLFASRRLAKVSPRPAPLIATKEEEPARLPMSRALAAGASPSASVMSPAVRRVPFATPPAKLRRKAVLAGGRRRRRAGVSNAARQQGTDVAALVGTPKGPPWVCQLCDALFKSLASLRSHRSRNKAHAGVRPSEMAAAKRLAVFPAALTSARTPTSKMRRTDKATPPSPVRPKSECRDSPEPPDAEEDVVDEALGLAGL